MQSCVLLQHYSHVYSAITGSKGAEIKHFWLHFRVKSPRGGVKHDPSPPIWVESDQNSKAGDYLVYAGDMVCFSMSRFFFGRMGPSKFSPSEARQDFFLAFREHIMEQSSECTGVCLLLLLSYWQLAILVCYHQSAGLRQGRGQKFWAP